MPTSLVKTKLLGLNDMLQVPMDLNLDLKTTKISQGSGDVMRRFRMDGMDGRGHTVTSFLGNRFTGNRFTCSNNKAF